MNPLPLKCLPIYHSLSRQKSHPMLKALRRFFSGSALKQRSFVEFNTLQSMKQLYSFKVLTTRLEP